MSRFKQAKLMVEQAKEILSNESESED